MKQMLIAVAVAVIQAGAPALSGAAPKGAPAVPRGVELSGARLHEVVEGLLMGYEPADPGEALRRIGPAAADVLMQIAQNPQKPPLRRLRAIEALGQVPTAAGLVFLR